MLANLRFSFDDFCTLCRSPTVSEKLWCVRFQESNGWFCSCAINMEYPTETLFIPKSLSRTKQKEYNGRNLVNFLWEFPHFCISVKVLLRWLSMHKFRHKLRQVQTFCFVLVKYVKNSRIFSCILDVIYELTMFLNIHFLSCEKWRICRYFSSPFFFSFLLNLSWAIKTLTQGHEWNFHSFA